jgi:hypothetical protein
MMKFAAEAQWESSTGCMPRLVGAEGATAPGISQAPGPQGRSNAGEREGVGASPPKGKTAISGQSLRFHDSAGRRH